MFVVKLEHWPQGVTTAREIGRCFITPMEGNNYWVQIDFPGNIELGGETSVEAHETDTVLDILAAATEQLKNNT